MTSVRLQTRNNRPSYPYRDTKLTTKDRLKSFSENSRDQGRNYTTQDFIKLKRILAKGLRSFVAFGMPFMLLPLHTIVKGKLGGNPPHQGPSPGTETKDWTMSPTFWLARGLPERQASVSPNLGGCQAWCPSLEAAENRGVQYVRAAAPQSEARRRRKSEMVSEVLKPPARLNSEGLPLNKPSMQRF